MATSLSSKALSNLVCESSVRSSETVLNQELERNLRDLVAGVLAFQSASSEPSVSGPKKKGKLASFLKDLTGFLNVADERSKPILTSYLAGTTKHT